MRLKLGMVGGGQGAFIGGLHRIAARLDGQWELVAGALSSDPIRAVLSAHTLGIAAERSYASYAAMATAEAARADGIDAVAIVTPNHLHAPVATAFLHAGIPVICDKPMTRTAAEAEALAALVAETGVPFILTQTYTGYAMVREARALVARGAIGPVRHVQVEYLQDWLASPVEATGQKQALWRTDPAMSGDGGCIADIGTHALNLATFVSGLAPVAVLADLTAFGPGRRLDDNAAVMLRFDQGAKGMIWATQIAPGTKNALRLRIVGAAGGLSWDQEHPDDLSFTPLGEPTRLLRRGGETVLTPSRTPAGHPEGYLDAFATLYADAAQAVRAYRSRQAGDLPADLPGSAEGVSGMRFVAACVASSRKGGVWVDLDGQSCRAGAA
ncbi:Gfo/Idh/MocA family protein [Paragemmobacter straminiformis]|uniref:Gfo/Idh/MocA family oxidoreductase n=1 Tax=Paragemmobacter straminiformis TaxID=2045119 RepID=A0A842I418_9RHOB|nr:Gfo/Idh/MocA family oxidoreductase [Gemmobacter straminiformis]MBC2834590.1 Gfo/Idh/MocA family oxidoreductase [Gemmobacter straminiformis]